LLVAHRVRAKTSQAVESSRASKPDGDHLQLNTKAVATSKRDSNKRGVVNEFNSAALAYDNEGNTFEIQYPRPEAFPALNKAIVLFKANK
jgi:hypothetical protein